MANKPNLILRYTNIHEILLTWVRNTNCEFSGLMLKNDLQHVTNFHFHFYINLVYSNHIGLILRINDLNIRGVNVPLNHRPPLMHTNLL